MKTSLEIAQEAELQPIETIAERAGLRARRDRAVRPLQGEGRRCRCSTGSRTARTASSICVTGMTPTKAGEGKTTTLGRADPGPRRDRQEARWRACASRRSGPVFGIKGGAAGGGLTQVVPMEDLNLHFTGDIHAIGAANNLLAAMIDASILHGNPHKIDALRIALAPRGRHERPRAAPDRGRPRRPRQRLPARDRVRHHRGLGGDGDHGGRARPPGPAPAARRGSPPPTRYDGGKPITAEDLGAAGAMTVLLKDAIKPNLVQTLEGQPVLMHCGPFANIAHGNNSLVADLIGMKLGDYVVTESGFGSDMGMEKFFDIVCRFGKLTPERRGAGRPPCARSSTTAASRTTRASTAPRACRRSRSAWPTSAATCGIVARRSACPRWWRSTAARATPTRRSSCVKRLALEAGAFAAEVNEGFAKGGAGAAELAEAVVERLRAAEHVPPAVPATTSRSSDKIETVAKRVYGAEGRLLLPRGRGEDRPVHRARGSAISRSAWRRRTCRCRPTRRCSTRPRTSRCRSATSAPTPAPAGSCRCAATSCRCPGSARRRRRSTSTSTPTAAPSAVLSAAAVTAYHLLGHG